jgi:hypothetical protein
MMTIEGKGVPAVVAAGATIFLVRLWWGFERLLAPALMPVGVWGFPRRETMAASGWPRGRSESASALGPPRIFLLAWGLGSGIRGLFPLPLPLLIFHVDVRLSGLVQAPRRLRAGRGWLLALWSPVPGQSMRQVTTDDAEPEVGHLRRFGHADPFQLDVGAARMLVKAYPSPSRTARCGPGSRLIAVSQLGRDRATRRAAQLGTPG